MSVHPLHHLGTSERTASTFSTLRRVWHVRHRVGVTRVSDLTALDRVGIPVSSATRATVDDAQITTAQGKGLRHVDALVSALMEAVERSAASRPRHLRVASVAQLKRERRLYLDPSVLGRSISEEKPIEWVISAEIMGATEALTPAATVLFPYFAPAGVLRPFRPSTTGLASGNTRTEAICHAIFEVNERHAVSRFVRDGRGRLIDPIGLPPLERSLVQQFERAGARLAIIDVSEYAPLPTFKVYAIDERERRPYLAVSGQGSHVSAAIALRRALTEAAQSRVVAIQGAREDLVRYQQTWSAEHATLRAAFESVANRPQKLRGLPAASNGPRLDEELMAAVLDTLHRCGFAQTFITDLTAADVGIPVVHAIVPGLSDAIVDPELEDHVAARV